MTLKERFERLLKKKDKVKKLKLVVFQTDWCGYFNGREMI